MTVVTRRVVRWVVSTVGALTLAAFITAAAVQRAGEAIDRAQWNDWPEDES